MIGHKLDDIQDDLKKVWHMPTFSFAKQVVSQMVAHE